MPTGSRHRLARMGCGLETWISGNNPFSCRSRACGDYSESVADFRLPSRACEGLLERGQGEPDHGSYGVGTGTDSSGGGTDSSSIGAGEVTAGDSCGVGTGEMAASGFAGAAGGGERCD
jgi:hypothetical protein